MNGKAPPVSELIGLIYETAEDPELWPTLLAGLAGVVEASEGSAVKALVSIEEGAEGRADGEMLDELLPHFERALRLHGRLAESRRRQRAVLGILDRLPLGILSVDEDLRVHAMNRQAETLLSLGLGLRLHGGRVVAETPRRTQALRAQVRQTMEEVVSTPFPLGQDAALSMLLTSEEGTGEPGEVPCCTLFIAVPGRGLVVSPEALGALFGLSPAEARLTAELVAGHSLEEAARRLHISTHTGRTQLKAAFAKTGTHRQHELVQRVLTSPAMVAIDDGADGVARMAEPPRPREAGIDLPGGRRLHYAEYGDPDGLPVLFFHSIVGSCLQVHPERALIEDAGLRWILPERPGFGASDPLPGRTLLGWAEDVIRLMDHLGIEKACLAGFSAGGAYAAACAWRHPQRFDRLCLISTMAPFDSLGMLTGMPPTNRMLLGLARHAPLLLGPFMRVMLRGLERRPDQITHRHAELWPQADREVMDRPGMREHMVEVFRRAIYQGPDAIVEEQILLAAPWGFDPAEIEVETHIWHGDSDIHVPLGMLGPMTRIPGHRLHVLPGRGHYLVLSHWEEIFGALAA